MSLCSFLLDVHSGITAQELIKAKYAAPPEKTENITEGVILDEFEYFDLDDDESLNFKGTHSYEYLTGCTKEA